MTGCSQKASAHSQNISSGVNGSSYLWEYDEEFEKRRIDGVGMKEKNVFVAVIFAYD
jgi:hypothetical protein